jgi:bacterioferritin-associated ferredoxin
MFVCICRRVTTAGVEQVIAAGARTCAAVEAACGAGGDCGTCRREIVELLRARRTEARADAEAA